MRSLSLRIAALVCALTSAYSSHADAHSLLAEPSPRDQQDGYKDASACGVAFSTTQPLTSYAAGQSVDIQWLETVDHFGCFLVEFSPSGDQDFQILGRMSHSNPPPPSAATSDAPRHWSLNVTLPPTPCTGCTLRLRQLMLDADVTAEACSATNAAPGSVYTTCANITLQGTGSGGGTTGGTSGETDSGCSVGSTPGTALSHSLVLGVALAAQLWRRRNQGRPTKRGN